jgi:hypothetical protein
LESVVHGGFEGGGRAVAGHGPVEQHDSQGLVGAVLGGLGMWCEVETLWAIEGGGWGCGDWGAMGESGDDVYGEAQGGLLSLLRVLTC